MWNGTGKKGSIQIHSVTADLSTKDKLNNYEQALDALSEIESISNRRSVFYWNPLTWDI
jgi:hypothetical protein